MSQRGVALHPIPDRDHVETETGLPDRAGRSTPSVIIEPKRGFGIDLGELWTHRELIFFLGWRDVKVRYKQTVLGIAWAVLQPLAAMVIFTIFLGRLAKIPSDGIPYPIFVYAGLVPWTFFANAITASGNSMLENERLITKVYFPRLAVPIGAVGAGLMDVTLSFLLLMGMMIYYDFAWNVKMLMIPPLVLVTAVTAVGVGTFLCALNVAYRDFRYVMGFLAQLWMFATPVVWPASLAPEKWRWLLAINPMTGLIEGFRSATLGHQPLDWRSLGISSLVGLICFLLGASYFRRIERTFADII
jgi:lipopolysaccharide transport system permease protein